MYGLLIAGGCLLAILLARKLLIKNKQYYSDVFWGVIFWMIVFGVIGARIYHVIDYRENYISSPQNIYKVWLGGLGIFGAIIGAMSALVIYTKFKKQNTGIYLDVLSIVAPIAQAVGRIGNYVNGELYGTATNLPWATSIQGLPDKYHPIFAYEGILNLILSFTLYKLYIVKKYKQGALICIYLIGYSVIRFFIEFIRASNWVEYGVNVNQIVCVIVFIGALGAYLKQKKS